MAMILFRIILLTEVISCSGSSQHPAAGDDPHIIRSRLQPGQDGEPCENDAHCENFACARQFATVDSPKVCCLFGDYVYVSPSLGFVCTGQEEGADCLNNRDDLCLSNVCVKGVCLSEPLPNGKECDSNADCFNFKCGRVTASTSDSDMICCPSDSSYFVDFLGDICGDQDGGKPTEPTPTPSQEPTADLWPTYSPTTDLWLTYSPTLTPEPTITTDWPTYTPTLSPEPTTTRTRRPTLSPTTSRPTVWSECRRGNAKTSCPEMSYCNDFEGEGGDCVSCDAIPAGPSGCWNVVYGRFISIDACIDACFPSWQPHECSEAAPCPDGSFCTFESDDESEGYCFGCNRVTDPLACVSEEGWGREGSLSPKGVESCASTCFQECSEEDISCSDRSFCNYMQHTLESEESSGFCSKCAFFDSWQDCTSWDFPLTDKGGQSCKSICFGCSADNPCQEGWFCDYQFGENGYCTNCDKVAGNPMSCTDSWIVSGHYGLNVPDTVTESCLNTCFDACSSDIACSENSSFCDFQLEDTGYCASCNATVDGDPFQCSVPTEVPEFGEQSCLDTCFYQCSSNVPCPNGSFCTSTDNGHCMDCKNLYYPVDPEQCLYLDISDRSKEVCLSSCFVPCTLADYYSCDLDDADWWTYGGHWSCVDVSAETGYCQGRPGAGAGPGGGTGCKFCPDSGAKEVEEILQRTTHPTASPHQETKGNVTQPAGPEGSNPPFPSANVTQKVEGDPVCAFCANDVMLYPERNIRAFYNTECSDMKTKLVPTYAADSRDCRIAELNQHICGCSQTSYAGADTYTKQAVLAWLPRCMAILSALGSIFIIADIACHKKRRSKIFGQLMLLLSSFDLLASIAYALTSLPIPAEDYIHGARGNDATCAAQGFFIAMGSVACYTNVSLAFYYLLMLKMGWSENKTKRRARLWLFVIPVAVGLIFALAGIPFFDSVILWCSNASNYWPDIPVAVAIAIATVVMGVICYHVYKEEKASAKWRGKGPGSRKKNSMTSMVAWQSVWYLAAFYLVWPPYLALQYMWASGRAYDQYGFTLAAGTLVPMQGFWNAVVYLRPRLLKREGILSKCFCPSMRGLSSTISNTVRMPWRSSKMSKARITADALDKSVGDQSGTKAVLTDTTPKISGEMLRGEHASERDGECGEDGGNGNDNDGAEDLVAYTSLFCSGDSEADEQQIMRA